MNDDTPIRTLAKHIETRLENNQQTSPTISISRSGWATIITALALLEAVRRSKGIAGEERVQ